MSSSKSKSLSPWWRGLKNLSLSKPFLALSADSSSQQFLLLLIIFRLLLISNLIILFVDFSKTNFGGLEIHGILTHFPRSQNLFFVEENLTWQRKKHICERWYQPQSTTPVVNRAKQYPFSRNRKGSSQNCFGQVFKQMLPTSESKRMSWVSLLKHQ